MSGGTFRAQRVRYGGQERIALIDATGARVGLVIPGRPGETARAFGYDYGPTFERSAIADAAGLPEFPFFAIEHLGEDAWREIDAAAVPAPRAAASDASVCPSCGEKNKPGAPFCGMCKAVLNRARPAGTAPEPIRMSGAPAPAPRRTPPWIGPFDMAELAARRARPDLYAQTFGVTYDFSIASVLSLDAFLDEIWGNDGAAPGRMDYEPGPNRIYSMVLHAAYLGEVLTRRTGGRWRQVPEHPNDARAATVVVGHQTHWPYERVLGRLREGSAHDLFSWLVAISPATLADAPAFERQAETLLATSRLPAETRDALALRLLSQAHALDRSARARLAMRMATLSPRATAPEPEAPREAPAVPHGYREPPRTSGPALVFLDPPHPREPDLDAVADALSLQRADARMRSGLAIPCPVALRDGIDSAAALARRLELAGLSVSPVPVIELASQPFEEEVRAFALEPGGLAFETSDDQGRFAWRDLRAAFVVSQSSFAVRRNRVERAALADARAQLDAGSRMLAFGNARGARLAGRRAQTLLEAGQGTMTETTVVTLHLVARLHDGDAHFVLTRGALSYEGMGARRGSGGQESWDALLAHVAASAPHVAIDRRAERAPPRFPALPGLGEAFGGKPPSPGWLHGAYLSWRAAR